MKFYISAKWQLKDAVAEMQEHLVHPEDTRLLQIGHNVLTPDHMMKMRFNLMNSRRKRHWRFYVQMYLFTSLT